MAKKGTVKVVKDPDTRVVICDERKKAWKDDYSYYYATKRRWPLAVRLSSDVTLSLKVSFICRHFILLYKEHYVNTVPEL